MTKIKQLSIGLDIGDLTVRKLKRAITDIIVKELSNILEKHKFGKKKITVKTGTTSTEIKAEATAPKGKTIQRKQISGIINFSGLDKVIEDSITDEVFVFVSQNDANRCIHCEKLDYVLTQKEYTLKDIRDMLAQGGKLSSTKTKTGKARKVAKKWIGRLFEIMNVSDDFTYYNGDQHPECRCVFVPLSIYTQQPNLLLNLLPVYISKP